jgi:hypothetical protein
MQQQPQMNVDLKNTTSIESPNGNRVFVQGVILRKVSKFVIGSDEDAIIPIPVFYDLNSGKILGDTLPKEIKDEYKDHILP